MLEDDNFKLEDELRKSRKSNEQLKAIIGKLTEEIKQRDEDSKASEAQFLAEIARLGTNANLSSGLLRQVQDTSSQSIEELSALGDKIANLEAENGNLKTQMFKANSELNDNAEQVTKLIAQLISVERQKSDLQNQLESKRNELEEKSKALESRLASFERSEKLEEELKKAKEELRTRDYQLGHLPTQNKALQEEILNMEERNHTLQKINSGLNTQNSELQERVIKLDQKILAKDKDLDYLSEKQQQERSHLQYQIDVLRVDKSHLLDRVADLESRLVKLGEVEKSLKAARQLKTEAQDEKERKLKEIDHLLSQIEDLKLELTKQQLLTEENKTLSGKIGLLEAKMADLVSQVSQLTHDKAYLKNKESDLMKSIEHQDNTVHDLKSELIAAKAQIEDLRQKVLDKDASLNRIKTDFDDALDQNVFLKKSNENQEILARETVHQDTVQNLRTAQKEIDSLYKVIEQQKNELAYAHARLIEMGTSIRSLTSKVTASVGTDCRLLDDMMEVTARQNMQLAVDIRKIGLKYREDKTKLAASQEEAKALKMQLANQLNDDADHKLLKANCQDLSVKLMEKSIQVNKLEQELSAIKKQAAN